VPEVTYLRHSLGERDGKITVLLTQIELHSIAQGRARRFGRRGGNFARVVDPQRKQTNSLES